MKRSILLFITIIQLMFVGLAPEVSAQNKTRRIVGVVTDEQKQPLIGATVMVDSNGNYATCNASGSFTLDIPDKGGDVALTVSYVGMEDKAVIVGRSQKIVNVAMTGGTMIEEIVIQTGYGTVQKRSDLTGSAFQVNSDQLAKLPAARVDNMLSGLVPGLQITQDNDNGRSSVSIRVRGDASLNASSEPLWVIDGIPVYTGSKTGSISGTSYSVSPLSMLNPDDIESMTVLKDAATTALYGADGGNGVILVTTKSGKSGKLSINLSARYGVSQIDRSTTLKMLNASQWWELAREGWVNSGRSLAAFPYQDNPHNSFSTTDTDWFDVYFGLGQSSTINFSASSGTDKATNHLSISLYDEKSTTIGNHQQRVTVRNRSKYNLTKRLSFDVGLSGSYNDNDILSVTSSYYRVLPIFSPYDEDGVTPRNFNYYSTKDDVYSPTMRKFVYTDVPDRAYNDNNQRTLSAQATATLAWTPINGLRFSSQFGADYLSIYENIYDSSLTNDGIFSDGTKGYSRRAASFSLVSNSVNRVNYNNTFGRHTISALAGIEFTDKSNPRLNVTGHGFMNDSIKELDYATSTLDGGSNTTHSRSLSYLGQFSYSYDSRYYLSLTARRQGYSSFGPYARFNTFYSAGLSWNVHNEKWFKSSTVNLLKLKLSYGDSGNSRIDSSSALGTYSYSDSSYYGGVVGATQSSPPNPGLSWETTYSTNIGVSIGLWKRIELEIEAYDKLTTNMLYSGRVSSVITSSSVMRNVGEIENRGIELTLTTHNISTPDFKWDMMINASNNTNVIKKLYKGSHTGFFDTVWMEGASKNAWWLVRWAGVDPVNGAPMWYDINGNLTYTFSYDNRVLLPEYSKAPLFYGGVTQTFTWRNLTLSMLFNYNVGGWDTFTHYTDGSDIIGFNVVVEEMDHWRNVGDTNKNPRYIYKHASGSSLTSTRNLISSTYVQLNSISLSYTLPKRLCKNLGVGSVNMSLLVDNAYLWTPGQSATRNSYKTSKYSTGMKRTYSGELSISF